MKKLTINLAAIMMVVSIAATVSMEATASNNVSSIACRDPNGNLVFVSDACFQTDVWCGCYSLTNPTQGLYQNP